MQGEKEYIRAVEEQFNQSYSNNKPYELKRTISFIEKHQNETKIINEKIAKAHLIIANELSKENKEEEILHYVKAIKYDEDILKLREKYLTKLLIYIENNSGKWTTNDLLIFKKELERYANYCSMKWGDNIDLYYIIVNLLSQISYFEKFASNDKEGPLTNFCKRWEKISSRYRPAEQALDYFAQILHQSLITKINE